VGKKKSGKRNAGTTRTSTMARTIADAASTTPAVTPGVDSAGVANAELERLKAEMDALALELREELRRQAAAEPQRIAELVERRGEELCSQARQLVAELRAEIRDERGEWEFSADARIDLIRRYKPGTIDELTQRLDARDKEVEGLRERWQVSERERQRLEIALGNAEALGHAIDVSAIERKVAYVRSRERELGELEAARLERDELGPEIARLRLIEERHEEQRDLQDRLTDSEQARQTAQLALDRTRRELELVKRRLAALKEDREEQSRRVQELQGQVVVLPALQVELEGFRQREADVREAYQGLAVEQSALEKERLEQEENLRKSRAQLHEYYDSYAVRKIAEHEGRCEAKYHSDLVHRDEKIKELTETTARLQDVLARRVEQLRKAGEEAARFEVERKGVERDLAARRNELAVLEPRLKEADERRRQALAEEEKARQRCAAREEELKRLEDEGTRRRNEIDASIDRENEYLERLRGQRREEEGGIRDRAYRVADIEREARRNEARATARPATEQAWLDTLCARIEEAEFTFPRRLIEAFHTCLKISYWSPITALAGVSGTGKSQLPRLYSALGGLAFELVSVQPNWDSPSDLLGFFDHVEGRYKATSLLRALWTSQVKRGSEGTSRLLLVLLDEMNLARIELYLSDFLSRLEMRGGLESQGVSDEQRLAIDIGAGEDPLYLPLGRNVLLVGTMNEDETTYDPSDKVIDRGNVLVFPRPKALVSRHPREIRKSEEALPLDVWTSWIVNPHEALTESARGEIQEALGQVNCGLAKVNRAVGHRVLQAIEAYVANHPARVANTADESAWKRPFEDQLVQKVMPKMKGIDTRCQEGKACLAIVEEVIAEYAPALRADFMEARDHTDGVFAWTSARYLEE